jgi:YD repeat-containing protein
MTTDGGGNGKFWRPPLWKWVVFLALVGCSAVVLLLKPAPRPVRVELLPFTDSPPAWDGAQPYLAIPIGDGSSHVKLKSSVSLVKPTVRHDSPVNEFAVDLHTGAFLLRQTDIFVPDVMPLSLTRTYRVWDPNSKAFGAGTNHPYDICPTGDQFPYTYMNLNLEDGRQVYLRRISKGTGFADAVFRHESTASEFYGAQVAWNGNGWTLTLRDQRQVVFPDSYHAKRCAQGAPVEIRDGEGHRIQLIRDGARNLQQLISPSGHTITFKYDDLDRIIEADDGAGQIRKYSYSFGHLKTVSDGVHILYEFEYQILLNAAGYDPYLMTGIKDGNGKELLRNWYSDRSRVSMQRLGDGEVYRYDYLFGKKNEIVEAIVTLPGGTEKRFFFESGVLVREK